MGVFPPVENRSEPGRSTRSSQSNRCHNCCGCKSEAAFQHRHTQIIKDLEERMERIELFCWTFSVLLVGFQRVSFFYLQFSSTRFSQHLSEAILYRSTKTRHSVKEKPVFYQGETWMWEGQMARWVKEE